MPKYRIVSVAGSQRQVLTIGLYLLLMLSTFAWQESIFKFQLGLQILLCASFALLATWQLRRQSRTQFPYSWLLDNTGSWQDNEQILQLSSKSRVSLFGVWVVLFDKSQPTIQQGRWFLPDQLSHKDYRRLSRVVLRCQSNH